MRLGAKQRKALYLIVLPLAVAYASFLASGSLLERISLLNGLAVSDMEHADMMRPQITPSPDIVEIVYSDDTARQLGAGPDVKGVPRKSQGELIRLLDGAGAKVALFDVMFVGDNPADPQIRKILSSLHTLHVTLATSHVGDSPQKMDIRNGVNTGPMYPVSLTDETTDSRVRIGSIYDEETEATSKFIGGNPIQEDANTHRRILYAPISAVLQARDVPVSQLKLEFDRLRLSAGSLSWALDKNGAIEARWTKSPTPFPKWDYVKAINALKDPKSRKAFEGKLVIVGKHDAKDLADTIPYGPIDGVDFIAQMTNTALLPFDQQGDAPPFVTYCFAILMSALAFLAVFTRRFVLAASGLALLGFASLELQRWLAVSRDTVFPLALTIGAVILSTVAGLVLGRYWIDRVDLSPPLESEEATVLFLDIKGSTALLNAIGRPKYQALINKLFSSYAKTVERSGGQIERTLGDGFLAIFRGSSPKHHALRCADCSRELVKTTQSVAVKLGVPVEVALGFESGILGGGYVKEGNKKTWSSLGSTINLAQRIQSQCGILDETILMGPVARRLMEGQRDCKVVTHAVVKGFEEEVEISKLS